MADGRLVFDTKLDKSGFKKGLAKLGDVAKQGFSLVTKAVTAASTALAGFAAYAIKIGSDFDAGMSEVAAISSAVGDDLQALRDIAKEMGATTKFSATESAEALKYMAQAGWKTEQMISGLPGVMHLAAASGEDLAMVSDIVTDSMTAFGMAADTAGYFADVLATASNATNTNVGLLGESFKYVASTAGSLGYSIEDTALMLGIMANNSIKGSMAGTALRSALSSLTNPTDQTAVAMKELGINMFDIEGNARPLKVVIDDLRASMGDLTQEQKQTYLGMLFGERAINGMLPIINASQEEYDALAAEMNNATGAAEEMAAVMIDNLQGDITILKSAVEGLGISLFEMADGSMRNAVQMANRFVDELNELITGTGTAEEKIDKFGKVVGEMLSTVAVEAANMLPKLAGFGATVVHSLLDGIQKNLPTIGSAAGEILSTFLSATVRLYPQLLGMGVELVTQIAQGISGDAHKLAEEAVTAIAGLTDTIMENLPLLLAAGTEIVLGLVSGIAENLPMLLESAVSMLVTLSESLFENLPLIIDSAIGILNTLVETVSENLPMVTEAAIGILMALVDTVIENLPMIIEATITLVDTLVNTIMENLPEIIDAAIEVMIAIMDTILDNLDLIMDATFRLIETIINAIIENLPKIVEMGITLILRLIDGIISRFPQIVSTIVSLIGRILSTIAQNLPRILAMGVQIIGELVIGIVRTIPRVLSALGSLAVSALSTVARGFTGIFSIGADLIKGLWRGISSVKDWIMSKISGYMSSIVSGIKRFFGISSPAKLMAEEIGKFLPPGISIGFEAAMPNLEKDLDKELADLTGRMKNAVEIETAAIGGRIAVESTTAVASRRDQVEAERSGMIHTEINIDGKPVGESMTPYVSNNLARKRARSVRYAY